MKKKMTLMATTAALAALLVVGATMAYFTSQDTATNIIKTGNVDIQVVEHKEDGKPFEPDSDDNKFTNLVPGSEFVKRPTVNNVGSNPAIVRAKVAFVKPGTEVPVGKDFFPNGAPELNEEHNTKWVKDGEYYYYSEILETTGEKSRTNEIFTTVYIPETWNNSDAGKEFDIIIYAEAVQAENLLEDDIVTIDTIKAGFQKYTDSLTD